jgi:hypothetical protein
MLSRTGNAFTSMLGMPPPQRTPEPGGGNGHTLFVWGTSDESGRVLLDGAPIGAPLHLGGLLPSVDPELIDDAHLRTGGASARFDGGTRYVLELSTRAPAAGSLRLWGESDLLTDRIGGEAPLGAEGSIMAGARRVRTSTLPRLSGVVRGYSYDDMLARASLRTGRRGEVRATLFGTDEALRIPRDQGSDEAAWRNRAASVVWQSDSARSRTVVRLSAASAMTDLPLLSALGGHLRGDVERATVVVDRRWESDRWHVGVGSEAERAWFAREARVTPAGALPGDTSALAPAREARCGIDDACARIAGSTAAIYGDVRYAVSERVRLDAGLRFATAPRGTVAPPVDLLPRVALEALVAPRTTVRLAAGRYSRLGAIFSEGTAPVSEEQQPEIGGPLPRILGARLAVDHATHMELSAMQEWGRSRFGLNTYLHHREGAPVPRGLDRALGLDASWTFTGARLAAGASYTYITRRFHQERWTGGIPPESPEHSSLGAEQLISTHGSVNVWRLRMSVAGAYARGIPYTSIVLDRPGDVERTIGNYMEGDPSPLTAPSARSYVRLDATVSGTWCVGGGECTVRLSPYVRVINALDRRDALFYYQGGGMDYPRALAALPAILSVGLRWEAARARR